MGLQVKITREGTEEVMDVMMTKNGLEITHDPKDRDYSKIALIQLLGKEAEAWNVEIDDSAILA